MESKPRAWEGALKVMRGQWPNDSYVPLSDGKILVECDRRDVLLRFTEEKKLHTHYVEDDGGVIYYGPDPSGICGHKPPFYIATPVADLLETDEQRREKRAREAASQAFDLKWRDTNCVLTDCLNAAIDAYQAALRDGGARSE